MASQMRIFATFLQSTELSSPRRRSRRRGPRPLPRNQIRVSIFLTFLFAYNIASAQNYALRFNGSTGYVTTAITRGSLGNAMTVEAWFRYAGTSTDSYQAIIGSYDGTGTTEFFIGKNAGNTDFGIQDGTYNAGMATASNAWDGSWHHFAFTNDNGTGKLYLDGTLKSTNSFTRDNATDIIYIGTEIEGSGYYFPGDIDEVRFWNTVRTASQITTYKDVELNGNETGLVAYYKMSNGSGTSLADNAAGSYPGTLVGGVTWTTGAVIMERTFSYTGSMQTWTVPAGITSITVNAYGAQGGNASGTSGLGAYMKGDFSVTPGQQLKILVGGKGSTSNGGGGGGGSFVTMNDNSILLIAGGGGGSGNGGGICGQYPEISNGATSTSGNQGATYMVGEPGGAGGTNGGGGSTSVTTGYPDYNGYGGAGYSGNGGNSAMSFLNDGAGGNGYSGSNGGFGGGGGAGQWGAGGGGGYSGGGSTSRHAAAGGGGSINNGTNQLNTSGSRTGNGQVVIYFVSGSVSIISVSSSLSAFSACSGTASASQNFTASGSGLSADITITAPTGYEVSTTSGNSGFASSVSLIQTSGTVASTNVYVRLTNAATGTPSGNVSLASTGATTQNVAVSGTVTAASVGGTAKW